MNSEAERAMRRPSITQATSPVPAQENQHQPACGPLAVSPLPLPEAEGGYSSLEIGKRKPQKAREARSDGGCRAQAVSWTGLRLRGRGPGPCLLPNFVAPCVRTERVCERVSWRGSASDEMEWDPRASKAREVLSICGCTWLLFMLLCCVG
jgi:hypothetical protein